MTNLAGSPLPPISREYLDILMATFKPQPVTRTLREDMDELLIDVGRQEVLNYMERKAGEWSADQSLKQTPQRSWNTYSIWMKNWIWAWLYKRPMCAVVLSYSLVIVVSVALSLLGVDLYSGVL